MGEQGWFMLCTADCADCCVSKASVSRRHTAELACIKSEVIVRMAGICCRHVECATYLMEQGADIFAIDKSLRR